MGGEMFPLICFFFCGGMSDKEVSFGGWKSKFWGMEVNVAEGRIGFTGRYWMSWNGPIERNDPFCSGCFWN